ncbi:MAG TPA: carboxypeptidase regulatory-like domain-containing protein [Bryobacteraceae bacterium]|jgi:hypothetical protein|nr:carboxypeptidase regulatory-like domain-containing protein [Bryobacteraceae bacterium]
MRKSLLWRLSGLFLAAVLILSSSCSKPPESKARSTATTSPAQPVYYKVDPATSGVIAGKVVFEGKRPPRKIIDMSEDADCSKLHKAPLYDQSVVVSSSGSIENVFVYVKHGLEGKAFVTPSQPVILDQKGCWYTPRVFGIQTRQILKVVNSDPVTHNIHPMAHDNRAWNQSQDPGAAPLMRHFIRPEIMIPVKCNVHAWMRAWIGVLDHPYFSVTGEDGRFEIRNLPPGDYTIEAWQEKLGTQEQKISLPASGKQSLVFTFKGA